MDAEEYNKLIGGTHVLDHTTLNFTLKELVSREEFELSGALQRVLENNRIEKPAQPAKAYDTSPTYYKVDLSPDQVEKIVDIFFELEEAHTGENGERTPVSNFYASLVDKWNELT